MTCVLNKNIYETYISKGFYPVRISLNKNPVDKDWNVITTPPPYNSRQLWGFMPPRNVVIVDVDVKNGKNGIDSFIKFLHDNPSIDPALLRSYHCLYNVQTPTGGYHYYIQLHSSIDYNQIPKTHPAYPGIDFITHGKAQAVAGGQELTAGWYTLNMLTIHGMITSLSCFDTTPPPTIETPSQPPTNVSQGHPPCLDSNLSLDKLKSLLQYIPADNYDDWYKVAFSLMSTPHNPHDLYTLWEGWSAGSPAFVSPQDCEKKWNDLYLDYKKPGKELRTVGSLVWMAKQASPSHIHDINNILHDNDLQSLRGRLCRVQSVTSSVHYFDLKIQAWLNEAGALKTMKPLIDYLSTPPDTTKKPRASKDDKLADDKDKKPKKVNLQALINNGDIHIPVDKVYSPQDPTPLFYDNHGALFLNTYSLDNIPTPLPYKQSNQVDFYLQHATQIFGKKYVHDFLSFVAYLAQNPGRKIRWMLVLEGGKGTGKGLLLQAIKNHVLGIKNCNLVNTNEILSEHNSWAFDYQLIHIDELLIRGKGVEKYMNTLKTLITEDVGLRREKYLISAPVPCCASFIALTNYKACLQHADSRRYHAIMSPIRNPLDINLGNFTNSIEYYNHLHNIVRADNPQGGGVDR